MEQTWHHFEVRKITCVESIFKHQIKNRKSIRLRYNRFGQLDGENERYKKHTINMEISMATQSPGMSDAYNLIRLGADSSSACF